MLTKHDIKIQPIIRELACGLLLSNGRIQSYDTLQFEYRDELHTWTLGELTNQADPNLQQALLVEPLWIAWLCQQESDQAILSNKDML